MTDDPLARVLARAAPFRKARQSRIEAEAAAARQEAEKARAQQAALDREQREADERDRPRREAEAAERAEQARLRAEAGAKARAESEAQARLDKFRYAFEQSGFPPRHRLAIDSVELTEAQQRARNTIAQRLDSGAMVALTGDRGCGKTLLATTVCRDLIYRDRTRAAYWTFAELVASYRETAFDRNGSESDWWRRHARVPLLVIDELGERRDTADEAHLLTRLLDIRYREMLGTLLITNTARAKLIHDLGESAMSRLSEGGCVIDGGDWQCFRGHGSRGAKASK